MGTTNMESVATAAAWRATLESEAQPRITQP
jgi:hypothetical protein